MKSAEQSLKWLYTAYQSLKIIQKGLSTELSFQKMETLFGFDNHEPKDPLTEIGYNYRGVDELMKDIKTIIKKEGFVYENE